MQSQTSLVQPHVVSSPHDTQVLQVLTAAAQRVAREAQSQAIASRTPSEPTPALELLAKQQHVLTVTAQAFHQTLDHAGNGLRLDAASQPSQILGMTSASQQVVLQAAQTATADRMASLHINGYPNSPIDSSFPSDGEPGTSTSERL